MSSSIQRWLPRQPVEPDEGLDEAAGRGASEAKPSVPEEGRAGARQAGSAGLLEEVCP